MFSKRKCNNLTDQNNGQQWPNNYNHSNKYNDFDNDNDWQTDRGGFDDHNHLMILTAHNKNNIKDRKNVGAEEDYFTNKENKQAWKKLKNTVTVSGLY